MPKILIIDDDPFVRTTLQSRLQKENFEVVTAETGAEGIALATRERPHLIVLDLAMPDIDGLDVLERLHREIITWDISVLVLTARGDPESRQRSQQLGVSRFFVKPLSPRHLLAEINRLLKSAQSQS